MLGLHQGFLDGVCAISLSSLYKQVSAKLNTERHWALVLFFVVVSLDFKFVLFSNLNFYVLWYSGSSQRL